MDRSRTLRLAKRLLCVLGGVLLLYVFARVGGLDPNGATAVSPTRGPSRPLRDVGLRGARDQQQVDRRLDESDGSRVDPAARSVHVTGLLRDPDSRLLSALTLRFTRGSEVESVGLGESGEWSIELRPGPWQVAALHVGCDRGLPLEPRTIEVDNAEQRHFLTLPSQALVRGTVTDCAGNSIPKVGVFFGDGKCATTTDGAGAFSLPAGFGPEELQVDLATLPVDVAPPWWQASPRIGVLGASHRVSPRASAAIVLPLRRDLVGFANGPEGRPLSGSRLSIRGRFRTDVSWAEGPNYVVTVEEDGSFRLSDLAPGRYEAWPFGGYAVRPDPVRFDLDCLSTGAIALSFDKGFGDATLLGSVADSNGSPMQGLRFGAWRITSGFEPKMRMYFHAKASLTSDGNGQVRVEGLPEGELLIVRTPSVRPGGLYYSDKEPSLRVSLAAGETTRFDWIVDAASPAGIQASLNGDTTQGLLELHLDITTSVGSVERVSLSPKHGVFASQNLPPGEAHPSLEVMTFDGIEHYQLAPPITLVSGQVREVELQVVD